MQWLRAPVFASASDRIRKASDRRKLSLTALFALIGILLSLGTSVSAAHFLYASIASFALSALFRNRRRTLSVVCLLISVLLLFSAYTAYRNQRPEINIEKKGDVTGVVCRKPIYQPDKNRTLLHLDDVTIGEEAFDYKLYVYIYGDNEENRIEYGQKLFLPEAGLWLPDGRTNPGGFDFASYLIRRQIAACASSSMSKIVYLESQASLTRGLYRLSDALSSRFDDLFSSSAGIMRALLLGDRTELDDETYESFQESGVAHLVALSGLHVSCVALFFEFVLMMMFVPSKARSVISFILVCLYAVMTGMSASIMRACMMYGFMVLARLSGRPSDLLTRLSGAFLIQAAVNPLAVQDTGMQLSYLSVLSLALMAKPLRSLLPDFHAKTPDGVSVPVILYNNLADAASASGAVQLGTLPSMASLFYSVPVLAIPVNLIVVPLGLVTVYMGIAAVILSFSPVPIAFLLGKPVEWVWMFITWLTSQVSGVSFALMNARSWKWVCTAAYFVLMLLASPYLTDKKRVCVPMSLSAIAFALVMLFLPYPKHTGLDIVFLDAGYADSCVIMADNNAYVYDCGKDNEITADYLIYSGARVRGVFISHPDVDHAGGAGEILKRYPDATVYVSECWEKMTVSDSVCNALEGREIVYLSKGDSVSLSDGITAHVIWPEKGFTPKEDNDGSLVVHVVYEDAKALLTGDITERVDKNITVDTDILKIAHHGSKKATSEKMLSYATPEIAVISVSANGHGHPTDEVLKRLDDMNALVYRTDMCGAITIHMMKDGTYSISTELPAGG